eukprot:825510-Amphidinium_carterae.1
MAKKEVVPRSQSKNRPSKLNRIETALSLKPARNRQTCMSYFAQLTWTHGGSGGIWGTIVRGSYFTVGAGASVQRVDSGSASKSLTKSN